MSVKKIERKKTSSTRSKPALRVASAAQMQYARLIATISTNIADIQRLRAANDAMTPLVQQALDALRAL